MLTALRDVASHEDAPRCCFSKEVWRGFKGLGGYLGSVGGTKWLLEGCGGTCRGLGRDLREFKGHLGGP